MMEAAHIRIEHVNQHREIVCASFCTKTLTIEKTDMLKSENSAKHNFATGKPRYNDVVGTADFTSL